MRGTLHQMTCNRLWMVALVVVGASVGHAQAWEKRIGPGISYRMEVDAARPLVIHSLRITPGAPELKLKAELAQLKVFDAGELKGKETLTSLVRRTGAAAGINGDFFWAGDPLGGMIRDGEVVSRPYKDRPVFAWGRDASSTGIFSWSARLKMESGKIIDIAGINEETNRGVVLHTESAGMAFAKQPSVFIDIELMDGKPGTSAALVGVVQSVRADLEQVAVPEGHIVLAARNADQSLLTSIRARQQVTITMSAKGLDWTKFDQAIGGGPFLLRNGKVAIDWQKAGFKEGFANNPHPRSAIGRNGWGDVYLTVVDGRGPHSAGVNLSEFAAICQRLGMTDAINLDGGGSTCLNLFGAPVSRPSDGVERPIANAVLLFAPVQARSAEERVIRGPDLVTNGSAGYTVIGADGVEVPNAEVVWTATGSGWIDQGGVLHALGTGTATINAWVRGQRHSITVQVDKR
ncbi:MAG: hypothetical protein HONBIEJF_01529 [Fimbriimonadaceae bacterium]|nr:hypothetical protein [Fimbriimonadaceae bacterium]